MDPLSLTCSAVALIDAAGTIASTLYKVVQSLRTADACVVALGDELRNLSGFLDAIDNALRGCRPAANAAFLTLPGDRLTDPTLLEDNLWQQSEQILIDCKMTLHELDALFCRIKDEEGAAGSNRSGSGSERRKFGWRARTRVAINLQVHGPTLETFRDKIQKSNMALQTILNSITISVMLRNCTSQQDIFLELHKLKASIDNVFQNTPQQWMSSNDYFHGRHGGRQPGDQSAARMARNFTGLVKAAQHFYSTASSAATVRSYCGSNIVQSVGSWEFFPEATHDTSTAAISIMGDSLSPFRLERVKTFVGQQQKQLYQQHSSLNKIVDMEPCRVYRNSSSIAANDDNNYNDDNARNKDKNSDAEAEADESDEDDEDDDDEIDYNRQVLDVTEELVRDQIAQGHFDTAVEMLDKTLQQKDLRPLLADRRRLRILLVFCYMLQHDWPRAEPLILELAAMSYGADRQQKQQHGRPRPRRPSPEEQRDLIIISNLLHALALAHLSIVSFDSTLAHCRQALLMKKLLKKHCRRRQSSITDDEKSVESDNAARTRDYSTTLGLIATIYEMTGDYIRAEVFNRQLQANQADFSYSHPASEVAFLEGHFALLGMVLGGGHGHFSGGLVGAHPWATELDASPFSPPSSHGATADTESTRSTERTEVTGGVDGSSDETGSGSCDEATTDNGNDGQQGTGWPSTHSNTIYGLLQRNGSAGADVAPLLRARHDQWERYERDTSKEVVVVIDDDGDSDAQTSGKHKRTSSGRLQRRLSKFFDRANKTRPETTSKLAPQPSLHLSDKLRRLARGHTGSEGLFRKPQRLLWKRASQTLWTDEAKSSWCAWKMEGSECWCSQCLRKPRASSFERRKSDSAAHPGRETRRTGRAAAAADIDWKPQTIRLREHISWPPLNNNDDAQSNQCSRCSQCSCNARSDPLNPSRGSDRTESAAAGDLLPLSTSSWTDGRQELPEDNFVKGVAAQCDHQQGGQNIDGSMFNEAVEETDEADEDDAQETERQWPMYPPEWAGKPVPWLCAEGDARGGIRSPTDRTAYVQGGRTTILPQDTLERVREAVLARLAHLRWPASETTTNVAAQAHVSNPPVSVPMQRLAMGCYRRCTTCPAIPTENPIFCSEPVVEDCAKHEVKFPPGLQNGTARIHRTFSWTAGSDERLNCIRPSSCNDLR